MLAMGDTDCFYTMIAGNNDKTAIQGNPGYATGCPELGVPESFYYDGPAGVTSIYEDDRISSQYVSGINIQRRTGICLWTKWKEPIIVSSDQISSLERRWMSCVQVTGKRTKDTMGEDPFLTGMLGAQQVAGVQSEGVAAMIKHYAGWHERRHRRQCFH